MRSLETLGAGLAWLGLAWLLNEKNDFVKNEFQVKESECFFYDGWCEQEGLSAIRTDERKCLLHLEVCVSIH